MNVRKGLAIALALGLSAAACGSSDEASETDEAQTGVTTTLKPITTVETTVPPAAEESTEAAITIGLQLEPATLDPTASPEGPIQTVELYNIIERW